MKMLVGIFVALVLSLTAACGTKDPAVEAARSQSAPAPVKNELSLHDTATVYFKHLVNGQGAKNFGLLTSGCREHAQRRLMQANSDEIHSYGTFKSLRGYSANYSGATAVVHTDVVLKGGFNVGKFSSHWVHETDGWKYDDCGDFVK